MTSGDCTRSLVIEDCKLNNIDKFIAVNYKDVCIEVMYLIIFEKLNCF